MVDGAWKAVVGCRADGYMFVCLQYKRKQAIMVRDKIGQMNKQVTPTATASPDTTTLPPAGREGEYISLYVIYWMGLEGGGRMTYKRMCFYIFNMGANKRSSCQT